MVQIWCKFTIFLGTIHPTTPPVDFPERREQEQPNLQPADYCTKIAKLLRMRLFQKYVGKRGPYLSSVLKLSPLRSHISNTMYRGKAGNESGF
jgi:hypothetical protein